MSWDHLSSKAPLHVTPDMVLVWNDVQRQEAVEMHGLPAERIVVTGAQCYDQWFGRTPGAQPGGVLPRDGAARRSAVRPVGALGAEPDARAARAGAGDGAGSRRCARSADPRLRELGVLVRPHPERIKEWAGVDLAASTTWPSTAATRSTPAPRTTTSTRSIYSSAVIGLVTSAFLEAAIVGRPVLTFTLPEYRIHQEEMLAFPVPDDGRRRRALESAGYRDPPRSAWRRGGGRRRA